MQLLFKETIPYFEDASVSAPQLQDAAHVPLAQLEVLESGIGFGPKALTLNVC